MQIWIEVGYEIFSREGMNGLKIESMARAVGISKSSFYHHFADIIIFRDYLLRYHTKRAKIIAAEENQCANIDPELITVLVNAKIDLLFNKQLRINRKIPEYQACLKESTKYIGDSFIRVWAKDLGLGNKIQLASDFLELSTENFFIQLNEDTINSDWLSNYFQNLKNLVSSFQR